MFRAAIVGGTPQPVQFASLLTRAGHTVVATSSPDAELGEWARAQGVPHFPDLGEFGAHCARASIDYLFSVVNYRMLSPALLQIPAKLAINYHDGPLP